MGNIDVLNMAIKNMFKRKLRTFLTIFGVIIGVVAIVLMISLGIGVNMNFEKQMENISDLTIIQLYNWEGYYGQTKGAPIFDDKAIQQIEALKGVEVVTPMMQYGGMKFVSGRYSTNLSIMGIRPEAMQALGYKTSEGTLLQSDGAPFEIVYSSEAIYSFMSDMDRKKASAGGGGGRFYMIGGPMSGGGQEERTAKVDVFNDRVMASYFYEYGNKGIEYPNNKKPDAYRMQAVGILEADPSNYYSSYFCFMNIEDVIKLKKDEAKYQAAAYNQRNSQKTYGYENGYIKCTDINSVAEVLETLKGMGFTNVFNSAEYLQSAKETTQSLQYLLAAIGAVSLFVAAIGIANTMIMAIYERTREIGIMKVIGAAIKDIRKLFLLEAALIGLIGGLLGLGLSYLASYVVNDMGIAFLNDMFSYGYYGEEQAKQTISYIPSWLALAALAFAALIGLISGYFPARRAMKLSALTAIKAE